MAKKTQSAVNYRPGTQNESCATCEFFQPPEACTQVSGTISAGGLCDVYSSKMQEGQGQGGPGALTPDMLEQMMFGGGLPQ